MDNGGGVSSANYAALTQKYATSKIAVFEAGTGAGALRALGPGSISPKQSCGCVDVYYDVVDVEMEPNCVCVAVA